MGKVEEVGGLTRLYFEPVKFDEFPTIQEFIKNIKEYDDWICFATYNYPKYTKKFYASNVKDTNYQFFVYAFAIQMGLVNPSWSTSWQIEHNAQLFLKVLKKKDINLSNDELKLLQRCAKFTTWCDKQALREDISETYQSHLKHLYLG